MSTKQPSSLSKYDRVADRIRQHRQADRRGILVVEGPSDKRLIDRITGKTWAIFPAGTRNQVTEVVRDAESLGVVRVAGLIDRDFDSHLEESQASGTPIYSYFEADLEAALVRGPWFERVLDEMGSEEKIAAAGGAETLRPIAVGIAGVVGIVRRANAKHGWGFDFKAMEFEKKVDARSLELSVPRLSDAIKGRLDDEARAVVHGLLLNFDGREDLGPGSFRGRDALEVVGVALRRVYGNTPAVDGDLLGRVLRLHADESLLELDPFPALVSCLG